MEWKSNEKLQNMFPKAPPKVYVDDTSMICKESTWSAVQDALAPCLIRFAQIVGKLKLSLSPKANIVSNNKQLSIQLKKELELRNICF